MSKPKHRVALVGGTGTWGRYYTRAYAQHPDCQIVALVDRAADRRQAYAERYNIKATYDSVDQLLADQVPDLVSAILPVAHTHDTAIACAEAGVKVVTCEKPIDYQLSRADQTVEFCRQKGTVLSCGTALWMTPYVEQTAAWISAGHIGRLTAAAIPNGLPSEVSGGGCHALAQLLLVTGLEAEWVEAWTLPPEAGYPNPEAQQDSEIDCPAYGRLGLSGGLVCEIPSPQGRSTPCETAYTGENGQVWIGQPRPTLIQGKGPEAAPIYPEFIQEPHAERWEDRVIARLLQAIESGQAASSGHAYRQVLEIAIAMKLSAQNDNQRISLPLTDRSLKLYPHPYRLYGGDQAGWKSIGYQSAPEILD